MTRHARLVRLESSECVARILLVKSRVDTYSVRKESHAILYANRARRLSYEKRVNNTENMSLSRKDDKQIANYE